MNWVKFRRIGMESSETIFPGMLIYSKQAFQMLFFHDTPKNPIISQI